MFSNKGLLQTAHNRAIVIPQHNNAIKLNFSCFHFQDDGENSILTKDTFANNT